MVAFEDNLTVVRPPLVLGAGRIAEARVIIACGIFLVSNVGQLTGDDRRREVIRVIVNGGFAYAVARVPDVESVLRRSSRRRPMSPISCILHGKSSACWSIVRTRALLSDSFISCPLGAPPPGDLPTPESHHCHLPGSGAASHPMLAAAAAVNLNRPSRARAPGRNASGPT